MVILYFVNEGNVDFLVLKGRRIEWADGTRRQAFLLASLLTYSSPATHVLVGGCGHDKVGVGD